LELGSFYLRNGSFSQLRALSLSSSSSSKRRLRRGILILSRSCSFIYNTNIMEDHVVDCSALPVLLSVVSVACSKWMKRRDHLRHSRGPREEKPQNRRRRPDSDPSAARPDEHLAAGNFANSDPGVQKCRRQEC
jgi:hypothetical protein